MPTAAIKRFVFDWFAIPLIPTTVIEKTLTIKRKEEDIVITLTHSGYIKRIPLTSYKQQKRGGVGIVGAEVKEEDIVQDLIVTSNLNYLLLFTNKGKIHWLKAYEAPEGSRYSKGKAIVNILKLENNEKISAILPVSKFDDQHFIVMATAKGTIKKTMLSEFSNPRKGGILAINLGENDELVQVKLTDGNSNLIIATKNGIAVRFNEKDVRVMGRNAAGVRGIKLELNDEVIGMENANDGTLLTTTENGYGKRTEINEYRLINRGGKGVINMNITEKTGKVTGIMNVYDGDEVLLISEKGVAIRVLAKDISLIGRNTQGVRVMKLKESDKLTSVAKVVKD